MFCSIYCEVNILISNLTYYNTNNFSLMVFKIKKNYFVRLANLCCLINNFIKLLAYYWPQQTLKIKQVQNIPNFTFPIPSAFKNPSFPGPNRTVVLAVTL